MSDETTNEYTTRLIKEREDELQAIRRECGKFGAKGKSGEFPTALAAVKRLRAAYERENKATRWANKKPKH